MASKSKRAAAKRGAYQRYTVKQRKAALRDADQLGLRTAAAKHGIPTSTLSNWWRWKHKRSRASTPAKAAAPPVKQSPRSTRNVGRRERRVAKSYTPSQRAEILEHAAANGVSAAHKKFDVSRFSIYDWQRKVRLAAEGKGETPTTGPAPADVEAQRDKERGGSPIFEAVDAAAEVRSAVMVCPSRW